MMFLRASFRKTIDVEPLSEARWGRIERTVFDAASVDLSPDDNALPADGRSASIRFRPAASLVLVGAFAAVMGAVALRALVQVAPQPAPTRVETAAIGSHVEFGESTVDVGPESAVRLTGDDARGVFVILDNGRVECDVTPRRGRPPFVVQAGGVEVRVIGTHFVVTRSGPATTVDVQRGQVEVMSGSDRALVGAGEHWPPLPTLPDVPVTASQPATAAAPRALDGNSGRSPAADSRPTAAAAPPALTLRGRYEAASKLEAQQPDAALALYRDLVRQGGAWGQNALFAEGRLEADRGNRGEASRLLLEYLARYPAGANANDARELLDRLR